MRDRLVHRGPDDKDIWLDRDSGVALGHTRLSVIDVSERGRQPMRSRDERYVLVFNGEIYSHEALREELIHKGHQFRGHSDTEVLLTGIQEWGFENAVPRMDGMFAIACWDRAERALWLARDRFGEKPLYYGWIKDVFVFGSEPKAITAHPRWRAELNDGSVALYMRHGYVPSPYSIYRNIFKLPAGSYLKIDHELAMRRVEFEPRAGSGQVRCPRRYWNLSAPGEEGREAAETNDAAELENLLAAAIRRQLVADVPVGAFLSGGIDSSTVVALMQQASSVPVRTFTIGFTEREYDEAAYARAIAAHLQTDHTELYVDPREAMAVIPDLASIYDEPFADASQIPTVLISRLARSSVTVALSGDAGDELFGGYDRYRWTSNIWKTLRFLPWTVRKALGDLFERMYERSTTGEGRSWRDPMLKKGELIAVILAARDPKHLYQQVISNWRSSAGGLRRPSEPDYILGNGEECRYQSLLAMMMCLDINSYLPDDILVKVDRASMSTGLEVRVPFLDPAVAEFAWSRVPRESHATRKTLLRSILRRYVPERLFERPKMGFAVPVGQWLRGPLQEWAETMLGPVLAGDDIYLDGGAISRKWHEHKVGRANWQYPLWNVLMFRSWMQASGSA